MAALVFSAKNGHYEATATINKDYALHVERSEGRGEFEMYQCSIQSESYGKCEIPENVKQGYWQTLDWTFSHGYYPMKVKFISKTAVSKAEINEVK